MRYVFLPAAVRRWCGLEAGNQAFLAAAPEHGVLVVHTMATLDAMVVRHHATLAEGRDR